MTLVDNITQPCKLRINALFCAVIVDAKCEQLTAELDGLDNILTNGAVEPSGDQQGDGIFDSISTAFKQFIVQGKDWIGNAKNLVRFVFMIHTSIN